MRIFDRVILAIYTVLLAILSLSVMLIAVKLIPLDTVWWAVHTFIYGQWPALLIGGVFFFVSVRLLVAGVAPSRRREIHLQHAEIGDIHIRMTAVESLVEKVSRQVKGVRAVKRTDVRMERDLLHVELKLSISPDCYIPTVTAEVQQKVQHQLKHTVGIEAIDVKVLVEQISNEFKSKQRVE